MENRTWSTSYRGPLLIHSGLKWDDSAAMLMHQIDGNDCVPAKRDWPGGRIVGIVEVVDCQRFMADMEIEDQGMLWTQVAVAARARQLTPWHFGPCCWELSDAIALREPIEIAGERGLWTPPDWVIAEVGRQTEEE